MGSRLGSKVRGDAYHVWDKFSQFLSICFLAHKILFQSWNIFYHESEDYIYFYLNLEEGAEKEKTFHIHRAETE